VSTLQVIGEQAQAVKRHPAGGWGRVMITIANNEAINTTPQQDLEGTTHNIHTMSREARKLSTVNQGPFREIWESE